METSIEERESHLKEDIMVINEISEFVRGAKIREQQMADYNNNLRASFDSEVQKAAMRIIEGQMSTAENDGGGTLKYTSN